MYVCCNLHICCHGNAYLTVVLELTIPAIRLSDILVVMQTFVNSAATER
jgi:hypothetical protein